MQGTPGNAYTLNLTDIAGLDSFLAEDDATYSDLMETGKTFLLHFLYGQKKSTSMNAIRYKIYRKRKNPPALKSLLPTDFKLALHIHRAHLQLILRKTADKDDTPAIQITNYGWG